eukprot:m.21336 g.21336  ORF g.21336 m.21336 type:complete len:466 (-) comp13352_c0_seq1:33-1430(-)
MTTRTETDAFGEMTVDSTSYYGAQTARSLMNFDIGSETMPELMIWAFGIVKKSSCVANLELGNMDPKLGALIMTAAQEVIDGKLNSHFPLRIWQTGSGTQSNMNFNEVIANRAIEIAGGVLGSKTPVHPNDHVNRSQSSNDTFPTAMNIAAAQALVRDTIPALEQLHTALDAKATEFADIIKCGRTHLMDATPLSLGQEFGGLAAQLAAAIRHLKFTVDPLYELPLGGSAVGTGLNVIAGYSTISARAIATESGLPFITAPNKFAGLGASDAIVQAHGALKAVAVAIMKIANDIRLLGSGPRCGLGELSLPANEPGSSIMPGKVNPTQCEAITMVCCQVIGNDAAITTGGLQGHLQLNVFRPMMIYNFCQSTRLISDSCKAFTERCVNGIVANKAIIQTHLDNSLMLVTALNPTLGYDKGSQIAKLAHAEGLTLRDAAVNKLGFLTDAEFSERVDPKNMIYPGKM